MKRVALLILLTFCVAASTQTQAQKKPAVETSPLCTRDYAIDTAKQQILLSRTFDNAVQRIAVVLRAADLLWPHEQDRAMAAFMEALDLAIQNFKENGDETRRTSNRRTAAIISVPDQRFKVITAIARRDPKIARQLSEKMLQETARETSDKPAAGDQSQNRTAEKLLVVAHDLVHTDMAAAVNFARHSLRYPATLQLPAFLYDLWNVNKTAADQLYAEALNAYGAAPMDQFLYLSSYPFGNPRDAGEMPSYMIYRVPPGFTRNRTLQRQFIQALLARTESAMEKTPAEAAPNQGYSEHAQMWLALNRLEKQIQAETPDLFDSATRAKDKLFALLNTSVQRRVNGVIELDNEPKESFDEQVEAAEKIADVARRDQALVFAVTGSTKDLPVEKVISVVDKISDTSVRPLLLNWFYYFRAQSLIGEKNLAEARNMAAKVTELDQRAYLYSRIAEESLKVAEDQTEAREMLNEVAQATGKAPKTIVSARALLALAYLYSKIDVNRGIEELGNAVRTINALEAPDFSQQYVMMKIEGETFGSFASFSTPGFNPENTFREMGKIDFDGSLAQATSFTDKSLRALTTLSVIEPCFATKSKAIHRLH
jgi:hypothetical protein